MKKTTIIVIAGLAGLVLLSAAKDIVIKISVEKGIELITGLRVSTRSFNVGIVKSVISIKGLKVYNPKGFPDPVMAEMPELYVDYDLRSIVGGRIHLRELRLTLKELTVVKNESGDLNLNSLKVVKAEKDAAHGADAKGVPPIRIDDFHLKIDRAVYKNYSVRPAPSIKEFNIGIDERYTDVKNAYVLVGLIVVRALGNTPISGWTNLDITGLQESIKETLSTAHAVTAQGVGAAKDAVRHARDALKNAIGDIGGLLSNDQENIR